MPSCDWETKPAIERPARRWSTCQSRTPTMSRNGDAIWTWCLAPDALEDLSLPVKRAEEFVANNSLNQRHFGLQLLGAALYRAGQYEQAAEHLEESIAAYPSDPPPGFDTINYSATAPGDDQMATGQARRGPPVARRNTTGRRQGAAISIHPIGHRRATLEVLRREAEALIGQKEADEAVENESRTSNEPKTATLTPERLTKQKRGR